MLERQMFKNNLVKLTLITLIMSLFLTSCATLKKSGLVKNPTIKKITIESFSLEKGEVILALNVFNPNGFSIPVTGLDFDLSLNAKALGTIKNDNKFDLPANKLAQVSLPIQINTAQTMAILGRLIFQKKVSYKVTGKIKTAFMSIPYTKKNEILVSELLKFP